ncbi:hypothetical protein GCM10022275_16320 [Tessaracoccus defluvii]
MVRLVIDRSELLSAVPGDLDFNVTLISGERRGKTGVLPLGEVFTAGAQNVADPVQRVVLASSVAVDVLLDPAADLVDRGGAELDNVERVEDRDGVFELVVDGVLVAMEWVQGVAISMPLRNV